jgi:GNAT superfamily N-acetyltransferase
MATVREAQTPGDIEDVRRLFLEYEAAIAVDLCFQGFAEELATLPGSYSRPSGRLLVAVHEGRSIGCVGLRPLQGRDCEMKRLYVRSSERARGIGRLLAKTIINEARLAGYSRILLDTLTSMTEARALYASFGFTKIPPYCNNPLPGAEYLALALGAV